MSFVLYFILAELKICELMIFAFTNFFKIRTNSKKLGDEASIVKRTRN